MSGGSYGYLYCKDSTDILEHESVVQDMGNRLAQLGYAEDAARETVEVLVLIRQHKVNLDVRMKRLSGVWRAVEWWDSGDSGEDGLKQALAEYRGE